VERSKTFFDIWLPRLSHFSQFGLFIFTVGAMYFTVLPLYQKALLEEAVARKEVELKQITTEVQKGYVTLRELAVRQYVSYVGAKCSGLLDISFERAGINVRHQSIADRTFAIDVGACLTAELKNQTDLRALHQKDYDFLEKQILALSSRIASRRTAAMRLHDNVPEVARLNPSSLPALSGTMARLFEITVDFDAALANSSIEGRSKSRSEIESRRKADMLKVTIEQEQNRIAAEYGKEIRNEVSSLKTLKWPN